MSNEKFKVKFGLAVGDTAATIDATTGDIYTTGDIQLDGGQIKSTGGTTVITLNGNSASIAGDLGVDGGDLTIGGNGYIYSSSNLALQLTGANVRTPGDLQIDGGDLVMNSATANVANTVATTVNFAGAATTVSIGANTGTTTVNNSLVADDISILTVDTTNLEVTNIKAKDGTAAATIADTTGIITVSTELNVDNINISGNTVSSTSGNNLALDPDSGTTLNYGHMILGQVNTNAILTTNGTGNLDIRTGSNPTSANINLQDGANGNITIDTDGTGQVIINADLDVNANITGDQLQIDNININGNSIISTDTNGAITLAPNGTGDVILNADTVQVGDNASPATITTQGQATLTVNAGDATGTDVAGSNTIIKAGNGTGTGGSGSIVFQTAPAGSSSSTPDTMATVLTLAGGSNGNITLAPNGTGNIAMTLANGGNATNTHNYVFGAIRNATTLANGNVWSLNQSANTLPYKGISLDNSANTAVNAGTLIRNYSNTGGSAPRVVFERSRGTAASPVTLSSGDTIGGINFTGYQGSGWFNDSITTTPAVLQVTAAENWASNTNVGTTFSVSMAPTATTISSGTNLVTAISHNPQTAVYRSDSWTFRQGKTGTTDLMTIASTGNVAITGDLRINGNDIQASDGNTNISLTSNTLTTFAGDIRVNGNHIQASDGNTNITMTSNTLTTVAGDLQVNGNDVLNSGGSSTLAMSNGNTTTALAGDTITLKNAGSTNLAVFTTGAATLSADAFTFEKSNGTDLVTIAGDGTVRMKDPSGYSYDQAFYQPKTAGGGNSLFGLNQVSNSTGSFPQFSFFNYPSTDGVNFTPTQSGQVIGGYKFNGNATTGTSPGVPAGPAGIITVIATENWSNTANGAKINFSVIKKGTITDCDVIQAASDRLEFRSDAYYLRDSGGTNITSAAVNYTRTYGEFAYTNAAGFAIPAQNTIYTMPLDTTNINSGVTISGTGSVNINVSGTYKLIMSLQTVMTTNSVGQFDFWLRKNGTDVANSKTQVDLLKDQKSVIGMDWMVQSNGTDYFEIVYASSSANYANITFPTIAASSSPYVSPVAPALILNVIPVGM